MKMPRRKSGDTGHFSAKSHVEHLNQPGVRIDDSNAGLPHTEMLSLGGNEWSKTKERSPGCRRGCHLEEGSRFRPAHARRSQRHSYEVFVSSARYQSAPRERWSRQSSGSLRVIGWSTIAKIRIWEWWKHVRASLCGRPLIINTSVAGWGAATEGRPNKLSRVLLLPNCVDW